MESPMFTKKNVKSFQMELLKLFPIPAGNCVSPISVARVPLSIQARPLGSVGLSFRAPVFLPCPLHTLSEGIPTSESLYNQAPSSSHGNLLCTRHHMNKSTTRPPGKSSVCVFVDGLNKPLVFQSHSPAFHYHLHFPYKTSLAWP